MIVCAKSAIFAIGIIFHQMTMTVTGIYEALNGKAESVGRLPDDVLCVEARA